MTTLTTVFARFIVSLDSKTLPAEVEEKARVCLLNGLGMGLDCHATPYAPVAREAVIAMDGEISGALRCSVTEGARPSAPPASRTARFFTAVRKRTRAAQLISAPS